MVVGDQPNKFGEIKSGHRLFESPGVAAFQEAPPLPVNEKVDRTTRNRIEDTSSKAGGRKWGRKMSQVTRGRFFPWKKKGV